MRKAPAALTLALAVPALAVLPVTSTPAPSPKPVAPQVTSLPLAGVDVASLAASSEATGRSAAARPAVLTAARRTATFSTLGVSWDRPSGPSEVSVTVRTHAAKGWTAWTPLEVNVDTDPSVEHPERLPVLTDPLYTGPSDGVQVRVDVRTGALPRGLEVSLVDPGRSDYDGVAVDAGRPSSTAQAATAAPAIRSRAQWGADESKRRGTPVVMPTVRAGTLHHTAGANGYSAAEVPGIIRGDYAYHLSKGFSDLAYNFVIDRFGTIWEGRAGGVTKAIQGAHAGGFNTETMGVSVLGNYELTASSSTIVESVSRVFGWKLGLFGRDPASTVTLTSAGGGTSKYVAGTRVTVPVVFAHRDVGLTLCPGRNLYSQMSVVRAKSRAYAKPTPAPAVTPPPPPSSVRQVVAPLTGDWDGDGREDVGWYTGGTWSLRLGNGTVSRFVFGRYTDTPVVGDWNGDGRDSIGIFRDGQWFLRNALGAGPHHIGFWYGAPGDRPVIGRWRPGAADAVGIVRGNAWMLRPTASGGATWLSTAWGRPTDVPVPGDWDGNGVDSPGLARAGTFFLSNATTVPVNSAVVRYGSVTDAPLVGDWNGDGRDTPGTVNSPRWMMRDDLAGGYATSAVMFAR